MLDAYASSGLPIGYPHWSYGKAFIRNEQAYRKGYAGARLRDRDQLQPVHRLPHGGEHPDDAGAGDRARQLRPQLVLQGQLPVPPVRPRPTRILDYLVFARRYVMECEERYGMAEVEEMLDSCHALMDYGVDRYKRAGSRSRLAKEKARAARARERPAAPLQRPVAHAAGRGGRRRRPRPAARSRPSRRRTFSTSSRSTRRGSRPGSASWCASCASWRSTSTRRSRPR